MASLLVRNVDDNLVRRLKLRAAGHGNSAEAEHRRILEAALLAPAIPDFDTAAAALRRQTSKRRQTPSEQLLREGRRERLKQLGR